jgi:hypothetical protein
VDARLERISKLVDRELTAIETAVAQPDSPPVDLERLESLARLVRQLNLTDTEGITNPYDGVPAELLQEVLKHAQIRKKG